MPNNKVTRKRTNDSVIDSALSDIYDKIDRLQPSVTNYTTNQTPPEGTVTIVEDAEGTLTMGTYTSNGWMVDINANFQPIGTRGFIPALGVNGRSRTPVEKEAVKYDRNLQVAIGGADKSKVKIKAVDGILNVRNANDSADTSVSCSSIKDSNDKDVLIIDAGAGTADDHVKMTNSVTGDAAVFPTVSAAGTSTNQSLAIKGKGTGNVYLQSTANTSYVQMLASGGGTIFSFSPYDRRFQMYGSAYDFAILEVETDAELKIWNADIDTDGGADISISATDDLNLASGNGVIDLFGGGGNGLGSFDMGSIFGKFRTGGGSYLTHTATATSTGFKIDSNLSGDDSQIVSGLLIDFDRTVAGSGTNTHVDAGINVSVVSPSLGTSFAYGIIVDVDGATSGTSTAIGLHIDADGADTNIGMKINTAGKHIHLEANADTDDYATIAVADTGDLTITTSGDGTTDSDLILDIDGDITLNADGGRITLADGLGAFTPFADSDATTKAYVDSFTYETKICNFSASSGTSFYLPLAGYVIEGTSTAGRNEYQAMIAPYDGTIEKFAWRSEAQQGTGSGTMRFVITESTDGTEVPGANVFRKDLSGLAIPDDTYTEYDLTSPGTGTFPIPLTKGRIYSVAWTTAATPYDTNCILVFKWDLTS